MSVSCHNPDNFEVDLQKWFVFKNKDGSNYAAK